MDPLARVPGAWPRHVSEPSAEHAQTTEIRALVMHSRAQSSAEIVRRMAAARRTVDEDDVELALLDAPGVVRTAGGRWQRA